MGSRRKLEARSTDVVQQRESIGQLAAVEQRLETDTGEKRMRGKGKETGEKNLIYSLIWAEIRLVPCGTTVPPDAGQKKVQLFYFWSTSPLVQTEDQKWKILGPRTGLKSLGRGQSGPVRSGTE